jgi:hypothetical protein
VEEFFREAAKKNELPGPETDLWRKYGMEWIGPPLKFE